MSQLQASGLAVGLPEGQMGNSEVGHMTLGLGRVIFQDLPRINQAIAQGQLAKDQVLQHFIQKIKQGGGCCHILGLLSPGGVHAHQRHILAFAELLAAAGLQVCLHAFLDGRDTPPQSALAYVKELLEHIATNPKIQLATISGRYYGMDRDNRWERTEKAYRTIADGQGPSAPDLLAAIEASYQAGTTDEFILPHQLVKYQGMRDGDGLFMANFRADRARQILAALLDPGFNNFSRSRPLHFAATLGLTNYSESLSPLIPSLFPKPLVSWSLGEIVARHGQKQLRVAETEKYAHVTFFFNGGQETPFPGEDRLLIPSPAVSTYDLAPEMSALPMTEKVVAAIASKKYNLIVLNYANTDMVGHTGVVPAIIKAVETVDSCLGQIVAAVQATEATLVITADHGNAEQLFDHSTGQLQPHTAHTCNPVPCILVSGATQEDAQGDTHIDTAELGLRPDGSLADVAPTILEMMGMDVPAAMSGRSLLERYRLGVGIMLINENGHIFVGQRRDISDIDSTWQMPQGGIDPGESSEVAALRELEEETGIVDVELLAKTQGWHAYDLPPEIRGTIWGGKYKGQKQQWFLARFLGTDDKINIQTQHPEFKSWRWVTPVELVQLVVPFKRELYENILVELLPLIVTTQAYFVPD